MKKLILCLVLVSGYATSHQDECVVCACHRQYEFQGAMNTARAQESFWRQEELTCERQQLHALHKERGVSTSPRAYDPACESKQTMPNMRSKLTALKKIKERISRR